MYSNKYDIIHGKWSCKRYVLLKKLGSGGIGEIYLVQDEDKRLLALKIGTDIISITKEYNHLKRLQHKNCFPDVYDLDDYYQGDKIYHFFTMEYIEGYTLKHAIAKNLLTLSAKFRIACLLAKIIKLINDTGYVYTDLKYENIMIDKRNGAIKLIDMGSIAKIGTTVKEYTPMYDRLCWGKGNRIADHKYQLFAIAVLLMSMILGRSFDPENERLDYILLKLKKQNIPNKVYDAIFKCIEGNINDCDGLYSEIACVNLKSFKLNRRVNVILNLLLVLLIFTLVLLAAVFACR